MHVGGKVANGLFYGNITYTATILVGAFAMSFIVLPATIVLGLAGATLGCFYGDEKNIHF